MVRQGSSCSVHSTCSTFSKVSLGRCGRDNGVRQTWERQGGHCTGLLALFPRGITSALARGPDGERKSLKSPSTEDVLD